MSVLGAIMVPHPPIILPEVGRGEEKKIAATDAAYRKAAAFAAELIAFVILALHPVDDWKYYAGSIICLAAVAVTCFGLIGKYNILSTRPIPSFFDRKGGNDRA